MHFNDDLDFGDVVGTRVATKVVTGSPASKPATRAVAPATTATKASAVIAPKSAPKTMGTPFKVAPLKMVAKAPTQAALKSAMTAKISNLTTTAQKAATAALKSTAYAASRPTSPAGINVRAGVKVASSDPNDPLNRASAQAQATREHLILTERSDYRRALMDKVGRIEQLLSHPYMRSL